MKYDRTEADSRIVTARIREAVSNLREQVARWEPRPMPTDWPSSCR